MRIMSPDRPLQDSGGGSSSGNTSVITKAFDSNNMVLSTIPPIESGHVIIQQQHSSQQQNNHQQQHHHRIITTAATNVQQVTNGINNCTNQIHRNSPTSIITKPVISLINGSPSKYVFFQSSQNQNGHGQSHITNDHGGGLATTYITSNHQGNNVGNIVLVTTEPMEINNGNGVVGGDHQISPQNTNATDEELTSLTWLQDKNLIKGIVACTNKSAAASPLRQSSSGALSPTSDFLEDSCVSEDNVSSVHSNSDQGISIHNNSSEYSPLNNGHHQHHQNGNTSTIVIHRSHIQTTNQYNQTQHNNNNNNNSNSSNNNNPTTIQYTNNNNNNNSFNSKNRNLILSPSTATLPLAEAAVTPVTSSFNASIPEHLVGATTTVHVGPSGTTTVVEYKTGSNFTSSPRTTSTTHHIPQISSSPRRTPPSVFVGTTTITTPSPSSTVSSSLSSSLSSAGAISALTPPTSSSSSGSSTNAHQHFHKKYIREQLNGCEQNNVQNGGGQQQQQHFNSSNASSSSSQFSPNSSISNFSDTKDYGHSTPVKQSPITVSYTTSEPETVIKEENSVEYPSGKTQNIQKPVTSPKQKHPTNMPYNPLVHTHNKPPYSFSSLIFMAIEDSAEKALPVKEIYAWIVQHFPYYKTAPTGWKNSVRHNLSLNKSFLKVEKAPNMGKGSLWRVEHTQRPNLIQALTRSPFFPGSFVDKISPQKGNSGGTVVSSQPIESPPTTPAKSALDSRLFPKLSKMIKDMVTKVTDNNSTGDSGGKVSYPANTGGGNIPNGNNSSNLNGKCGDYNYVNGINGSGGGGCASNYDNIERLARDCGADSIDDVNAATAMLALKHGPKVFNEAFPNGSPVITSSPSEDHTYSAGGAGNGDGGGTGSNNSVCRSQNGSDNNSNGASSDVAYESSEESPIHEATPEELEERRRHIEGVDALLSFASKVSSMSSSGASSPVKRPAPDDDNISLYNNNNNKESNSNSLTNSASEEDNLNGHLKQHQQHHHQQQQQQRTVFTTQGFYGQHILSSSSPAKRLKTSRNLRNKIKRKSAWIR